MRSTYPTIWRASKEAKEAYGNIALTIMGQLKSRLELAKIPQGWVRRTLKNGTRITCITMSSAVEMSAADIIRIEFIGGAAGGRRQEEEQVYIKLESGWVSATIPFGSAAGALHYPEDIEEEYNNKIFTNPYLDAIHPTREEIYEVRNYTAAMDSIPWRRGSGKEDFLLTNHSAQSGKLKLLWQAQMGRWDGYSSSIVDLIAAPNLGVNGYGLYTTTQGDYYLIRVTAYQVAAAIINFRTLGRRAHDKLKEDLGGRTDRTNSTHEEYLERESYILGEALSIGAWVPLDDITMVGKGQPIYYGWRFSWDGDKAGIVTHQKIWHDQPGNKAAYWRARRFSISITESGGAPTAANITENEDKKWRPETGKEEIFMPCSPSLTTIHYWKESATESYGGSYSLDQTFPDGIPIDLYMDDSGNPVILACRKRAEGKAQPYTYVRNLLDGYVHHCGGGTSSGQEQVGVQATGRAFFIREDSQLSYDNLKQMDTRFNFYSEYRSFSSGATAGRGPKCADQTPFIDPVPPDSNYRGIWCNGDPWNPADDAGNDGCNPVSTAPYRLSGSWGTCTMTLNYFNSNNDTSSHVAAIIQRFECEGWELVHYATNPGGEYTEGYQDFTGFLSGSIWEDGEEAGSRIARVPGIEYNVAFQLGWSATNWPIPYNNSLSHPPNADTDGPQYTHDALTTAAVTVFHHKHTKGTNVVLREDLTKPVNDVVWNPYNALFDLTRFTAAAYPYLNYTIYTFRGAISDVSLYTGKLDSGTPSKLSNDNNLDPSELLGSPGSFIGRT